MSMLLESKFFQPRSRQEIVARPRLLAQLQSGLERKLILVLAQAGFGKTTLVVDWLHTLAQVSTTVSTISGAAPSVISQSSSPRVAWLSLDENDNDPLRFFDYLITALQRADPSVGEHARYLLTAPQPPTVLETLVVSLINDLANLTDHLILTLDDYHTITSQAVHQAMHSFISHAPPFFHLMLVSRVEPPLPLTRWRMHRDLIEIRENDLRFTLDEAMTFLVETMHCTITRADVAALEQRTEGWIVGLHLAALSLQQRTDAAAFIADFTGSHAYIVDYLTEEVLQRQPPEIQEFLFQTSYLTRFSGPLCDAVMGHRGSQQILEYLERSHLFVIPLDSERGWYRYHHLFAEMLRRRAQEHETRPGHLARAETYRRAMQWHLDNGLAMEAIDYALGSEESHYAAQLIEHNVSPLMTRGHFVTLLQWLDRLPGAVLRSRPLLCATRARLALRQHNLDEAERWLDFTWKALDAQPEQDLHVASEAYAIRVDLALNRGQLEETIRLANEALAIIPEALERPRGEVLFFLAIAYFWEVHYEEASAITLQSAKIAMRAGDILIALNAWVNYARFSQVQGKLQQSMAALQQIWAYAIEQHVEQQPLMATFHVNQGEIYYEWNRLDAAEKELLCACQLAEQARNPRTLTRAHSVLVRVYHAQGKETEVAATVQHVEQLLHQYELPSGIVDESRRPIVRLWLENGNLDAVAKWLETRQLALVPDVAEIRGLEPEYFLVARYLAARQQLPAAADLLTKIITSAQRAGQIGSCVDIQVFYALVLQQMGDVRQASDVLTQALALAESQSFIRTFLDEGKAMQNVLTTACKSLPPKLQHYVGMLLQAFGKPAPVQATHVQIATAAASSPHARNDDLDFVEHLSKRELEVLRLVDQGLSDSQVAAKLVLATGTVKRHLNNIYGKLGVHNRTHALARARLLKLL